MRFTEGLIKNKYVVWALVIAAVIFGIQAYFSIPMQLFPDTAPPLINVITAYPGAGAKDVNETLSQKLEEEFASLDGVIKTKATSQDNLSIISVEFDYERDVDLAAVDIQNSISRIKNTLPAGITDPQVLKFSTSDKPVVTIGIISDDLTKARKMSEDVFAPTLQRIQGVAAVDVFGGNKPALIIELNRRDVEAYRIPFQKVVNAVREFNYSMPAGQIRTETTQTMFRLESRAENIEDIRNIPISLPNGNRLLLGEISSIKKGSLDDDARFSIDGRNAIAIQIFKTYDANTVEVVKKSLEKAKELDSQYSSYSFITGEESATFTEISVSNLLSNVWQALLFASIIIFLFLGRIRSSLVTIVSMPLSFGLTFVLMKLFNVEFNMVTLSAIILAVGMVVDSSIVILENITRRMMEEGESPEKAAINGTSEVGLAVLAGVATTLSVLIPLLFLEGFTSKTFGPLALTLIFAFSSSIAVAFVLVPVLTLYTAGKSKIDTIGEKVAKPFQFLMDMLRNFYTKVLEKALNHRTVTLFAVLILFVVSIIGLQSLGMETLPKMDGGSFSVSLQTPSGSSLEETAKAIGQIESFLTEMPEVEKIQSQSGFEQGMKSMSSFGVQGPTQGSITVTLSPRNERDRSIWEIQSVVRNKLRKIPGIAASTVREIGNTAKATTSAPIVAVITGNEPVVLDRIGNEVVKKLSQVPNVIEPVRSWDFDHKSVAVKVDDQLAVELGISPATVAQTMNMGSNGISAGEFFGYSGNPDPVLIRYSRTDTSEPDDILGFPLFAPGTLHIIPLRAVAKIEERKGQGVFTRENLISTLEVSAFSEGRALSFVINDVEKSLSDLLLPQGYGITITGEKSDLGESKKELIGAFLIAIIAVYLLLVAQLRSFIQPVTIMISIPLSMIGVFLALFIAGKYISMPVMVGLILLVGIVVNNAIILIEFINQERERGVKRKKALINAVTLRFRPIMMTSFSTVVGMIPLSLELALGSERFSPLATAIIGGMTAATFLTMIVVPVFYDVFDSMSEKLSKIGAKK
ncbi:MAG TPA: efflux RND transporter permease subunit [bacterium]|nr:efflux RND transporter permease subunit [bacterium]